MISNNVTIKKCFNILYDCCQYSINNKTKKI